MRRTNRTEVFVSVAILLLILSSNLVNALAASGEGGKANSQLLSTISVQSGSIVFQTANVILTLSSQTGSISGITNLLTGQHTVLSGSYPLWSVSTINGTVYNYQTSYNDFYYNETSSSQLIMHWSIPHPSLATTVVVKADSSDGGVDLGINVTNHDPSVTILHVNFPFIAGFKSLGGSAPSDSLLIPVRDGLMIPDLQQSLGETATLRYEYTGSLTMQFFLVYDNDAGGIYEGVEDPGSNFKALEVQNSTFSGPGFKFFWELYAPSIYPGNQFTTNYFVTIAGFSGVNWENGAALYRAWASGQFYTEKGPLLTRTDVPTWFKDVGLIWKVSPPDDAVPSTASSVNSMFPNETTLLDLWGWNRYGFDRGYGVYFPPIDGQSTLVDAISQIHEEGNRITLFFSGDLYDTNATINPLFPSVEKYMVVDQDGQLYLQGESNGAEMAVPDPASQWWQSELVNFSVTAVHDYGADGVYLDGLVDQPVVLNYQNATSPTLSGSTWWEGYAQALTNLTAGMRQYNPNAIVTTEGESEIFIPYIDGFWDNMDQDNPAYSGILGAIEVPAFSFVYHEFELSYGTPYAYTPSGTPGPYLFRYTISEALAYGLVIRADLPSYTPVLPSDSDFLLKATEMEQNYSEYLRFGQMLPGPYVSSQSTNYSIGASYSFTVPAVSSGLFQANDGSDLLVVSNPTSSNQEVGVRFYDGEFGPNETVESAMVCPLGSGAGTCLITNSSGYVTLTVGNLTDAAFRVIPVLQSSKTSSTSSISSQTRPSTSSMSSTSAPPQNNPPAWTLYAVATVAIVVIAAAAAAQAINRRRSRKGRAP